MVKRDHMHAAGVVSQPRMVPGRQDHQVRLMGFRSPTEDTGCCEGCGVSEKMGLLGLGRQRQFLREAPPEVQAPRDRVHPAQGEKSEF